MSRPYRLLDLFCGAGGAAVGYHRDGFTEIMGVDHNPQPRYPFQFVQADALSWLGDRWTAYRYDGCGFPFDAIHASPPCQRYSCVNRRQHLRGKEYPDLIADTREVVSWFGVPYVIENVELAPLRNAVRLCGSYFGLPIRRHRLFESNLLLFGVPCQHYWQVQAGARFPTCFQEKGQPRRKSTVVQVYGHTSGVKLWPAALGIDWMNRYEMTQAIPPAFTEFIGRQLLAAIGGNP